MTATDFSYYQDEIIIITKKRDDKIKQKKKIYHDTIVIPKMVGDELV